MKVAYDKYYKTANLFGQPYPELMDFFAEFPDHGTLLDLGCGQGRDAIPLARLGFDVTGVDNSKVGIEQMNQIAKKENLKLKGVVADIFEFDDFAQYDFVLLDSMFHFTKKGMQRETGFIKRMIAKVAKGGILIFCIQDTGKKIETLDNAIASGQQLERLVDRKFMYIFEDSESGHKSETDYRLIAIKK